MTATNAAGNSAASATVNVTPDAAAPLALVNVQSRKNHVGIGAFDIDLAPAPLPADPVTVEPRTLGSGHLLLFHFNNPVTIAGTVSAIDAVTMVALAGVTSAAAGNDVTVTLPTVADNKRIRITIDGVNGVAAPVTTLIGFLIGDINGTRSVTAADISGVKARSGQVTSAVNFRFDVNATGAISSADISAVKARSGLSLP